MLTMSIPKYIQCFIIKSYIDWYFFIIEDQPDIVWINLSIKPTRTE